MKIAFTFASLALCGAMWAATQAEPQASEFAPIDYFEESCARCHGSYGSFYGDEFGAGKTDAELHAIVREMAEGPAQAPLEEKNLEALVAYHISLRDNQPFLILTEAEKAENGWNLRGEVSPDATLELDGKFVEVEGHKWKAVLAPNAPGELKASLKPGAQSTLQIRAEASE